MVAVVIVIVVAVAVAAAVVGFSQFLNGRPCLCLRVDFTPTHAIDKNNNKNSTLKT